MKSLLQYLQCRIGYRIRSLPDHPQIGEKIRYYAWEEDTSEYYIVTDYEFEKNLIKVTHYYEGRTTPMTYGIGSFKDFIVIG